MTNRVVVLWLFRPVLLQQAINRLERKLLELLQYNVTVTSSLYTRYYFELRDLAIANNLGDRIAPLSKEEARLIEARTCAEGARISRAERRAGQRRGGGGGSLTLEDVTRRTTTRAILS